MVNDEFKCTLKSNCLWTCCIIKTEDGFKKCTYLKISSNVVDEMRG